MHVHTGTYTSNCVPSTGAGFGIYTSVDFALLMDVLKNKQDHAKDIAVWHQVCIYYTYVSIYVRIFRNIIACMCVCMYVCMYTYVCVCACVRVCVCKQFICMYAIYNTACSYVYMHGTATWENCLKSGSLKLLLIIRTYLINLCEHSNITVNCFCSLSNIICYPNNS